MDDATPKPEVLQLELRMSFAIVLQHPTIIGGNAPVYIMSNIAAGMGVEERVAMLRMLQQHCQNMLRQQTSPQIVGGQ